MSYIDGKLSKEDFFDRIKNACANPDEAGNQLPPENIMITCLRGTSLWGGAVRTLSYDFPNECVLDVWIWCDKDIGSAYERIDLDKCYDHGPSIDPSTNTASAPVNVEDIDSIACARFLEFDLVEYKTVTGITCEDIKDVESIEEYCSERL